MYTIDDLKKIFIRKDGKLNSPQIKSAKNKQYYQFILEETDFLPEFVCFTQRWWHILHGKNIPICNGCLQPVLWNDRQKHYNRFCSQKCAVKSNEARERTRKQFKGKKVDPKIAIKSAIARTGLKRSKETKEKLSKQKLGSKNPQYGKPSWNKGMVGPLSSHYGKKYPNRGKKGKDNPQYGKSPSPKAGRGIQGSFNGVHFRSSLELFYLIHWYEHNIKVCSGETKRFRVKYLTEDNKERTYSPDFYIIDENILCECKPENLHTNKNVVLKFAALKQHHTDKKCKLLGFKDISQTICGVVEHNRIDEYVKNGLLKLTHIQYERLRKNYADIIRATI